MLQKVDLNLFSLGGEGGVGAQSIRTDFNIFKIFDIL